MSFFFCPPVSLYVWSMILLIIMSMFFSLSIRCPLSQIIRRLRWQSLDEQNMKKKDRPQKYNVSRVRLSQANFDEIYVDL